jgi:hypothetical protein
LLPVWRTGHICHILLLAGSQSEVAPSIAVF